METKFQVHTYISKLYASVTSNIERKQSEEKLQELGDNVIQHVADLSEIISSPEIPPDNPIKLQTAAYMQSYIKNTLKKFSFDNAEIQFASESLIKLILMKSVAQSIKVQLGQALEATLFIDSEREIHGLRLVQKFFQDLVDNAFTSLGQPDCQIEINGLFLVVSALFKTCRDHKFLLCMFDQVSGQLTPLVSTLLIQVLSELLEQTKGNQASPDMMTIQSKLYIVRTWATIHLDMLKKFKTIKFKAGLKYLAGNVEYARLFSSILRFFVPSQTQPSSESDGTLITMCGVNSLDLIVNEIKSKVLSCLKIIWTFLVNKKPKDLYSMMNPYIEIAVLFQPVITQTLAFISAQCNPDGVTMESLLQNGHINSIAKTGIDVLILFSGENEFQQLYFIQNSFKLYLQVILPFLKISEKERDDIESQPKEFVNYAIDICSKQQSKTYKSQAAKLLEAIIDHIDGMLTFAVDLNIQIMLHALQGESSASMNIKQVLEQFNLKFSNQEELLDVCLLSLTVMSYSLVKRPDLIRQLDQLIVAHLPTLLSDTQTPLIKSRMCLFLSFYLDQILGTEPSTVQESYFEKILYFLLGALGQTKTQKIVALQALDALTTQINEPILTLKIQQNFEWIIETLAIYNVNLMLHAYFDFLGDFIKTHYSNFTQDNLVIFMRSLVERIQNEITAQEAKVSAAAKTGKKTLNLKGGIKITGGKRKEISNKANIRINKCWNTIRFIAEHDYFADNYLSIVENTLLPLFEYLVTPQLIDFDDDIIFCLCSLIKKSKQVSPTLRKIFPFLPKFQEKYKGIFGNLLVSINNYIVYGKDYFEESRENLGLLFQMANRSMFRRERPVILGNNLEGALLLHMTFQNLDGPLIKQAIGDILTNVLARLKDQPMSNTFQRVLLEVFYSAMLLDVNITLEFLKHAEFLDDFFKGAFDTWRTLRLSYERKLFALAMSNFIFNSTMPPTLSVKAGFYLRELVSLLMRQQRIDQKIAQAQRASSKKKDSSVNPIIDQILFDGQNHEENSDGEEQKSNWTMVPPQQIFQVVKEGDANTDMEVQLDIEEEEKQLVAESDFKQEEYDLQFNVTQMITRINEVDEFDYFTSNFKKSYAAQPVLMEELIASSFLPKHKEYLKTILSSKRILLHKEQTSSEGDEKDNSKRTFQDTEDKSNDSHLLSSGESQWVPRKILTAVRRHPTGEAFVQQNTGQQPSFMMGDSEM